jgi:hypothetical protein
MALDDILDSLPPGWRPLGRTAWETCQRYDPPAEIVDAKAKWGEFVIHISPREYDRRPEIWRQVSAKLRGLRERAETMCEECGEEGRLVVTGGWYSTLCAVHEREQRVLW